MCVAFESVSVAGVRRGGGASWSEALTIARGMEQGFTLIQHLGYQLYPSGKRLHAAPSCDLNGGFREYKRGSARLKRCFQRVHPLTCRILEGE